MEKKGKNILDQIIFLLSCFYDKSEKEIKDMPVTEIYPMMKELEEYLNKYDFDIKNLQKSVDTNREKKKVKSRFELMNLE